MSRKEIKHTKHPLKGSLHERRLLKCARKFIALMCVALAISAYLPSRSIPQNKREDATFWRGAGAGTQGENGSDPMETTTIGIENPPSVLAAGPFLIDKKLKEGEPIPHKLIGDWFILEKSMTWGDGVEECEKNSAHLAILPSLADAEKLIKGITALSSKKEVIEDPSNFNNPALMEFGISRRYWIGLTDQVEEGKWMWVGIGYPLEYDFWYPGQPSHNPPNATTAGEHCGSLWNPGYYAETENTHTFNDAPCTEKYYPICYKGNVKTLIPDK